MRFLRFLFILSTLSNIAYAQAASRPVVLELFTSQGCNSCPPADALLHTLANDPSLLALSFHVDYWDYIGWKDAFSLKESTQRQYAYAKRFDKTAVFTPQLIIDGQKSVIGSREYEVRDAIAAARKNTLDVPLTLTPDHKTATVTIHFGARADAPSDATILAIRFQHAATTEVKAGENKGQALVSTNSVTKIETLGSWSNQAEDFTIPANKTAEEGIAILLQNPRDGRILAAQSYIGL